jgi:hypothetical protein
MASMKKNGDNKDNDVDISIAGGGIEITISKFPEKDKWSCQHIEGTLDRIDELLSKLGEILLLNELEYYTKDFELVDL